MKIAICSISTNHPYWPRAANMLASVRRHMPDAKVLLFTDCPESFGADKQVQIESLPWPYVTMARYRLMLSEREWLSQFTHVFWLDSDMEVIRPIRPEEMCCEGTTGALHYGFAEGTGTPETNQTSASYLPNVPRPYFTGAFQGGAFIPFMNLCVDCQDLLERDIAVGYIPRWHDESALQKHFHAHPPAKVLRNWGQAVRLVPKGGEDRPSCCGRDLLAIVTCQLPVYRARRMAQNGWIERLRSSGALSNGIDLETFDGPRLNVSDTYLDLPHKIQAMCRWAYDRLYRRLLKIDCDTYLDPAGLWRMTRIEVGDYAGCVLTPRDSGHPIKQAKDDPPGTWPHPYAAGGAYWLTRRAMKHIIDAPIPPGVWCEDRWVGHVLAENGISAQRIPEYNFFPSGQLVKMNVPTPDMMKRISMGDRRRF